MKVFDVFKEGIPEISDFSKFEIYPVFVQKKYDGARHILSISPNRFWACSDDGSDHTAYLPLVAEQSRDLVQGATVVLDCEIEIWEKGVHQPREIVTGFFAKKPPEPDENIVVNVFDCLYYKKEKGDPGDIHNQTQAERLRYLRKLNFPQSTVGKPDVRKKFNLAPTHLCLTKEALKESLNYFSKAVASEGAMLKLYDFRYSLSGLTTGMLKFKKYAEVHAIVLKRLPTKKKGIWNYEVGVEFAPEDNVEPNSIWKLNGKEFTYIGRSYNTKVFCEPGDVITLRFHTLNLYTSEKSGKHRLHIYEPIFYEKRRPGEKPDTFKTLVSIGDTSGLLERKYVKLVNFEWAPSQFEKILLLAYDLVLTKGKMTKLVYLNPDLFPLCEGLEISKKFLDEDTQKFIKSQILPISPTRFDLAIIHDSVFDALNEGLLSYETFNSWLSYIKQKAFYVKLNWRKAKEIGIIEESKGEILPVSVLKALVDPFSVYMDENEKWEYMIHTHWRGRSVHFDVRHFYEPRKEKVRGLTLNVQVPKVKIDPVLTLEDARKAAKNPDLWKIVPYTGEWKFHIKRGAKKPTYIEIVTQIKAPEPVAWFFFEGVTPPGTVGATKNYPGVFLIIERAEYEQGAQKSYAHEFFYHGKTLKTRCILRKIPKIWKKSIDFDEEKVYIINREINYLDASDEELLEALIPIETASELKGDLCILKTKPVILPPGEGGLGRGLTGWVFIRPLDPTPYVLSRRAVKVGWMPPLGNSCIPRSVRKKIPKEYRYWKAKNLKEARKIRDELVANLEKFVVFEKEEIEFEKAEKAEFTLQYQFWKGPATKRGKFKVVRAGPSRSRYNLLLSFDRKFYFFILDHNISETDLTTGFIWKKGKPEDREVEGEIPPKTRLNDSKNTWCVIEKLDEGSLVVFEDGEFFKKFQFKGKQLKGLFAFRRHKGEEFWMIKRSELPSNVGD